ncbi:phage tail sheath C-terminal domain-containing protein [Aeromonas veronii]|uniref:phage tail sheath C-terminal domain-containing protein n=1 Tax=Aeromonas veronii TaxID=654 RepID=UPI001010ED89|nr:phage tail sheath C-terminal domain-containing protein [Aeromonas veronii]
MVSHSPGVSIVENIFLTPNNIVESAVPLFVGYTQNHPSTAAVPIKSINDFEMQFGGAHDGDSVLYYTVKHFFDNGGKYTYIYSLGSYQQLEKITPEDLSLSIKCEVLTQAIQAEQSITLISFPEIVLLPDNRPELWHDVWDGMLLLCQLRPGLFAIMDAPYHHEATRLCVSTYVGHHRHCGGVWWPSLVSTYIKNDLSVLVPPSGAVIATIQNTDEQNGVWSAPANFALSEVIKPLYSWYEISAVIGKEDCPLNIIRTFPGKGVRIWGCRTFTDDNESSFRYVQTRRFISWCESNISRIGRMFMFESNNEITWYKLKGAVTNWLRQVWYQGGLYGVNEHEAFHILLGQGETMNEQDIYEGRVIMRIKLAVVYPAEFIELTINFNMNAAEPS